MATECFLWVGTRFLDAFAKLRRVTVRFVMSVRLPACEISAQTGRGFVEFDTDFFFFRKSVEKIELSLKSDKKNGHFIPEDQYTF